MPRVAGTRKYQDALLLDIIGDLRPIGQRGWEIVAEDDSLRLHPSSVQLHPSSKSKRIGRPLLRVELSARIIISASKMMFRSLRKASKLNPVISRKEFSSPLDSKCIQGD
jgi:hypothetical protein